MSSRQLQDGRAKTKEITQYPINAHKNSLRTAGLGIRSIYRPVFPFLSLITYETALLK